MVEHVDFRALLQYLNPMVDTWLPASHTTIQLWSLRIFEAEKIKIQQALHSATSKIHFTVDLWTSPNTLSILGAIAHYTAENGELKQSCLALTELDGDHSGPNQAHTIMEIIEEYSIASKVGYFMMDNAENNDTMMRTLETSLNETLRDQEVPYNGKQYRLRCKGHIINLAAQSFLFQTADEALEDYNNQNAEIFATPSKSEMEEWRKKGPLGKLHNIVVSIKRSPQRLHEFMKLSQGKKLVRDNATRWNSWYRMLDSALDEVKRNAIDLYCSRA
jgi:hypothetical protein